jgi:hypothetical protein
MNKPAPARACENCKHSNVQRKAPPDIGTVLVCKQGPPTTVVSMAVDPRTGQAGMVTSTTFPVVKSADWCSQFAADLRPVDKPG